jgi:superfamily I DNA/RNA helicase
VEVGLSAQRRQWLHAFRLGTGTSAEIGEARRPLYVAMTRAKDDLYRIVPQAPPRPASARDRHLKASTRFIPEKPWDCANRRCGAPTSQAHPTQNVAIDGRYSRRRSREHNF